ncbi:hypothetical protein SDC9_79831 [bioreactor metagenome]|uniref:Uncharacterized protein n=1 Tax=bioreactor metagenome TaxID=1076179 RepID=A0A644YZK2_9ZZZZ
MDEDPGSDRPRAFRNHPAQGIEQGAFSLQLGNQWLVIGKTSAEGVEKVAHRLPEALQNCRGDLGQSHCRRLGIAVGGGIIFDFRPAFRRGRQNGPEAIGRKQSRHELAKADLLINADLGADQRTLVAAECPEDDFPVDARRAARPDRGHHAEPGGWGDRFDRIPDQSGGRGKPRGGDLKIGLPQRMRRPGVGKNGVAHFLTGCGTSGELRDAPEVFRTKTGQAVAQQSTEIVIDQDCVGFDFGVNPIALGKPLPQRRIQQAGAAGIGCTFGGDARLKRKFPV